jgi:hypothetical protein
MVGAISDYNTYFPVRAVEVTSPYPHNRITTC